MPTNIEIKAVVHDWERTRQAAEKLSDLPVEILEQEDTFFACAKGRLKLRRFSSQRGELIAYQREETAGTKSSHYRITKTDEPERLGQVLADALGTLGIVRKQRHLYLCGQTRIHLDKVEGLGTFLELEVVMRTGQQAAEGEKIAREIMEKLGIKNADLLAGAYLDLLTNRASPA